MMESLTGPLLTDKVVLITGGANGIGRATVSLAAAEGADVAIFDIDVPRMEEAAAEVESRGRRSYSERVDITQRSQVDAAVKNVLDRFGRIDVFAAVAGGSGTTPTYLQRDEATGEYLYQAEGMRQIWTEDISEEDWDGTLDFNLKSVFLCTRAVLPAMKAQGGGSIVAFSSIGAVTGQPTSAFAYAAYAASKAGVTGFVRHLAREVGPFGIRVNCVSPGAVSNERMVVRGEMFSAVIEEERAAGAEIPERQRSTIPLGRASDPAEQASAVIFLASDRSSYISGATLDVNGALHMR
jgi:NAD(P)-dependent dehydrogenase (short-subunit alcohol dehydrogenase family)